MKLKSIISFSVLGLAVFVAQIQADTLRLRDGRVITGSYLGGNETGVRFQRQDGGVQRFNVNDVDSILFGNSGAYNSGFTTMILVDTTIPATLAAPTDIHSTDAASRIAATTFFRLERRS